jgi:hypothetical protein
MHGKLLYPLPACHVSQSGQHIVPTLPNVPKEKRAFLARSCKQKHQNMIIVIWSAWPFWRSLPSMYVLRNVAHLLHTWWLPNAKTLPSLFLASAALLRQLTGLTTRRAPFTNRNRISRSVDLSIGGSKAQSCLGWGTLGCQNWPLVTNYLRWAGVLQHHDIHRMHREGAGGTCWLKLANCWFHPYRVEIKRQITLEETAWTRLVWQRGIFRRPL